MAPEAVVYPWVPMSMSHWVRTASRTHLTTASGSRGLSLADRQRLQKWPSGYGTLVRIGCGFIPCSALQVYWQVKLY